MLSIWSRPAVYWAPEKITSLTWWLTHEMEYFYSPTDFLTYLKFMPLKKTRQWCLYLLVVAIEMVTVSMAMWLLLTSSAQSVSIIHPMFFFFFLFQPFIFVNYKYQWKHCQWLCDAAGGGTTKRKCCDVITCTVKVSEILLIQFNIIYIIYQFRNANIPTWNKTKSLFISLVLLITFIDHPWFTLFDGMSQMKNFSV